MQSLTLDIRPDLIRFVRFLLVGVVNTMVGLSVIYGAKFFLGAGDVPANVAGYAIGLCVSFLLNKRWTFHHQGRIHYVLVGKFLGAFLIAYAANLTTVMLCIEVLGVNSYLAQLLGIAPYTTTFFLLSRFVVFREDSLPH